MTFLYDQDYNTETRSVWWEGEVVKFMNYLRSSSVFADLFKLEVEDEILMKAKLILLNSFNVWKVGLKDESVSKLKTSDFVSGNTTFHHLLINSVALVNNELDEGNPLAKGHPASHFLPALVEVAKEEGVSGHAFLEAFILAYELSARMGASVTLDEAVHPHGNALIYGGTFGIGKLKKYNQEMYEEAAKLNMNFQMPTLWQAVLQGHQARNLIIGLNNQHLYQIDWMIKAGYRSSKESVLGVTQLLASDLSLKPHFTDFSSYYLEQSYFKFLGYCRFTHGPVEAVLKAAEGIDLEQIHKIEIESYQAASRLNEKEIRSEFQGKFSIPYAVANELAKCRQQPDLVKDLIEKIEVRESKELTERFPNERIARVKLTYGKALEKSLAIHTVSGDAKDPDAFDRVIAQATELEPEFIDRILNLENEANMYELLKGGV